MTFSLLPDCLASRYGAELVEMEEVVAQAAEAPSQEAAVAQWWPEIGLVGALRKLRRWRSAVTTTLALARGLLPELGITEVSVAGVVERLGGAPVLTALREKLAEHLHALPPPVGFGPRLRGRPPRRRAQQHEAGPDPPQ